MPDREKVIKGLEICSNPGSCRSECPYYEKEAAVCSNWLLKDALEMLKVQEPVKVVRRVEEMEWTVCSNCGSHIISKWKWCPGCGRAVKWECEAGGK